MQGLTNEVKQFVLDLGMDLVGIASTDKLDQLTPKGYYRPKDLLKEPISINWVAPIIRIADFRIWDATATPFAVGYASMPARWDQIFPNGNQFPKGFVR